MKILYLVPRNVYLEKMSRVRFHQIREIAKISDLKYSGFNWDNYQNKDTVEENVNRLYNGDRPDIIIGFDHRDLNGFKLCTVPKVNMMNEMHSPEGSKVVALEMLKSAGYDFIICHHKNEMDDSTFDSIRYKLVNIPHHVDGNIFKDYGFEKTIDVLLCGSLVLEKYKLRRRFVNIIKKLKNLGLRAKIHEHPGGYHSDAYTDRYLIDFAKSINCAKICLTCSSIHKCVYAKYVEIPFCNSLLAGDIPNEREDFFKSFMLGLNDNQTDDEMVSCIIDLLNNPLRLKELTNLGMNLNKPYTMDNYAKKFIDETDKFLKTRKRRMM